MKAANRKANKDRVAPEHKPAAFTITVGKAEAIGPFTEGQELTELHQIGSFFRQHVAVTDNPLPDTVTNEQIVAVVKATDVSKLDPDETANERRLAAVQDANFADADTSEIPPMDVLRSKPDAEGRRGEAATSVKYGAMVPDSVKVEMDKTIAAIQEGDAGPVLLAYRLEQTFKDTPEFFDDVPPIGSRYRGGKGDKAPPGYRLESDTLPQHGNMPVWRGPFDYYSTKVKDGATEVDRNGHWVGEFVGAKIALGLAERLQYIRDAKAGKELPRECPDDIRELKTNSRRLASEEAEAAFQFNRRVRICGDAFRLIQGKRAIHSAMPTVTVELFGRFEPSLTEAPEAAARRRKPYTLVSYDKHPDTGKEIANPTPPYPAATIKNAVARIAELGDNPTLTTFLQKKTKTKGTPAQPTGATATEARISNVDIFVRVLSNIYVYTTGENAHDTILARCKEPTNGGMVSSAVVNVFRELKAIAENPLVQQRALDYDNTVEAAEAARLREKNKPEALKEKEQRIAAKQGNGQKAA